MQRLLLALATILLTLTAAAQNIRGRVTDTKGQPVVFANVVLLQAADSSLIEGTTSAEDGTFTIGGATLTVDNTTKVGRDTVATLLRITCLGYQPKYIVPKPDMGNVVLIEDTNVLGEAVVNSTLPKTRLKNGGMITNVAGTVLERAGTAEQLLNRLPAVTAKDGKVEVFGRGTPVIYINGRRVREEGELTRLSSENIKSVEVITNPGARYDATTTSVVRITTKPRVGDGFSLYSQSWLAREEAGLWRGLESLSLGYRYRGLDIGGSLYYNQWARRDDRDLTYFTYLDQTWRNVQQTRQRYDGKDFFAKFRASYAVDESNSIGFSVSYNRYPELPCMGTIDANLYENSELSEAVFSLYDSNERRTNWNGNAYYVGKIGKVGIDFNTDWLYGTSDEWMKTTEQSNQNAASTATVGTTTDKQNRLIASKLVLTAPLLGGELSVGGEYSHSQRKTRYDVLPKNIIDDDNSRIEEGMTSAFIDYRRSFGRLALTAGLRYEYVDFDYYENGVRQPEQCKTFSDFFPSFSLTAPVGKTEMMLTYSSDVSRPSYWLLRSNVTYANHYTYETGNPFLVPMVRSNLEYTLSYKHFTYSAMFSHMKHPLMWWGTIYNNQPSTMLLSYRNGSSYNLFVTHVSYSRKIGHWTPMFMAAIMKQWIDLPACNGHSMNNPKATFRFNNTLETKLCDITLQLFCQTEGGDVNEYFGDGYIMADLSLRRSFLRKKLSVQLDIDNLFHTGERTLHESYGALQSADVKNLHQQLVSLTIRYSLNTTRSKYRGTGAGQSQKSRL